MKLKRLAIQSKKRTKKNLFKQKLKEINKRYFEGSVLLPDVIKHFLEMTDKNSPHKQRVQDARMLAADEYGKEKMELKGFILKNIKNGI